MKKILLILLGVLILISIITAGTIISNILTFKDRDVSIKLNQSQLDTLNNGKSMINFYLGNITCKNNYCSFPIYKNNKIYTYAYFNLKDDLKSYSESDFLDLRDNAVDVAIKYKIRKDSMNNNIQKVNVGGNVNLG